MFRIYDYKCSECEVITKDVMVEHTEKDVQVCSKCGGKLIQAWLQAPAVNGMDKFGSSN